MEQPKIGGTWEVDSVADDTWHHVVQTETGAVLHSTEDKAFAAWLVHVLNDTDVKW